MTVRKKIILMIKIKTENVEMQKGKNKPQTRKERGRYQN